MIYSVKKRAQTGGDRAEDVLLVNRNAGRGATHRACHMDEVKQRKQNEYT